MVKLSAADVVDDATDKLSGGDFSEELFNPQDAADFEKAANGGDEDNSGDSEKDSEGGSKGDSEREASSSSPPSTSSIDYPNPFPDDPRIGPENFYISGIHRVNVPLPKKTKSVAIILLVRTLAGTWQYGWSTARNYGEQTEAATEHIWAPGDQCNSFTAAAIEALDDLDSWWVIHSSSDDTIVPIVRDAIISFRAEVEIDPLGKLGIGQDGKLAGSLYRSEENPPEKPARSMESQPAAASAASPAATESNQDAGEGEETAAETATPTPTTTQSEGETEAKASADAIADAGGPVAISATLATAPTSAQLPTDQPPAGGSGDESESRSPMEAAGGGSATGIGSKQPTQEWPVATVPTVHTHEYLVAIADHHEEICRAREELRRAELAYSRAKEASKEARKEWEKAVERLAETIDDKPELLPLFDGKIPESQEEMEVERETEGAAAGAGEVEQAPAADHPKTTPKPKAQPKPPAEPSSPRPSTVPTHPDAMRSFYVLLKADIIDNVHGKFGKADEVKTACEDAQGTIFLAKLKDGCDGSGDDDWAEAVIEPSEYKVVEAEPPAPAATAATAGPCSVNPSGEHLFPSPPLPHPAQFAIDGKWENLKFDCLLQYGLRQTAVQALQKSKAETIGSLKDAIEADSGEVKSKRWFKVLGVRANYVDEIAEAMGRLLGAVGTKRN